MFSTRLGSAFAQRNILAQNTHRGEQPEVKQEAGEGPDSHLLPEGVDDLVPEDLLDVPVGREEGLEEHGVQDRGAGEEAVAREQVLGQATGAAATLQTADGN